MPLLMYGLISIITKVCSSSFPFLNTLAGQVYEHKSGSYEGLHSVKVIGWGVQNGIDYW